MFITQEVTLESIDALLPYARNSRTHSDAQVAQLAAAMREFGFTAPVMVRDGTILAGHGRLLAARKLGIAALPRVASIWRPSGRAWRASRLTRWRCRTPSRAAS